MTDCCKTSERIIGPGTLPPVPVSSDIHATDILGTWMARWNIGRMKYRVEPGLYFTGNPDSGSEVFVSANYKMSFDILRKNLKGINAWIIVLDTRGINVWCAAGKGTFGTNELVRMITGTGIRDRVKHSRIIVPQLGAPGIAAHEVKKRTGMKVVYGPVRASDIPAFLTNKLKADLDMRRISFGIKDRLILVPTEIVLSLKYLPIVLTLLFVINVLIGGNGMSVFFRESILFTGAFVTGTVLFPMGLPLLPFRSFYLKGWLLGVLYTIAANLIYSDSFMGNPVHLFILPVLVSYLGYNFTGSTTYTNLSGVEKELKAALPSYGISLMAGMVLMILNFFGRSG